MLLYKIVIPRTVVRLGVREIKTKGRVGVSTSVEMDLSNPQAKTEGHEDTKLCLDKTEHFI